jgi:hypothetical protein
MLIKWFPSSPRSIELNVLASIVGLSSELSGA